MSPKVFKLLTTMNLSPILIRVKASARRFNQLDNCVLPCKALYWPYTVPREILLAFYTPLQTNWLPSRKSTQQRASKFPNNPSLQRRGQISSINSPYALSDKIFSPITYPSRGIGWLLCECESAISYYPQRFQVFNHNSPLSSIPATFWKIR